MSVFRGGPHPRAFAHRGWHLGELAGAENTMVAFRRAVDEGYLYLETDVHTTADGVLVMCHDPSLDRTTDRSGHLATLPWSVVREAKVAGRYAIPQFADVLELLEQHPNTRLNVDCKSAAAVGPLAGALNASPAADRVLVAAFSDQRLARLSQLLDGQVVRSAGPREVLRVVAGLPVGLAIPRRSGRPVALQVPLRVRGRQLVTGRLIARAHRQGLEVHVWTINDSDTMHRLLDLGVDGLITDRPDLLRDVIDARG